MFVLYYTLKKFKKNVKLFLKVGVNFEASILLINLTDVTSVTLN